MKSSQPLYLSLYEKLKIKLSKVNTIPMISFLRKTIKRTFVNESYNYEHAYQLLLDEGFIYSKPRSGYYVSDIESLPVINRETYPNNDHLEIHNESNENSQFKFAFNLAGIDSENFPMHIFRKYAKDVFEEDHLSLLQRGEIQGEFVLRQQIAHYLFNVEA